ncbi:MAG: hypothetical protein HKP55_07945 [Gammaproteobacteria bacterium]|nr:hypothetical protein [Gammaproteobacteria bacterium]
MKLIQQNFLKGTFEYELTDEEVKIRIKTLMNEKFKSVPLEILNPEPVINSNQLDFHSRVKCGPLISLQLNKPDEKTFNTFVNAVKQKALEQFNDFAGLK